LNVSVSAAAAVTSQQTVLVARETATLSADNDVIMTSSGGTVGASTERFLRHRDHPALFIQHDDVTDSWFSAAAISTTRRRSS